MLELCDKPLRIQDELAIIHYWRLSKWLLNLRLVPRWHERYSDPATWLYRTFFYDGLTRTGKTFLCIGFVVFLFNNWYPQTYHLSIAAFTWGLLLGSGLLAYLFRPRISVRRDTPMTAFIGETLTSRITIANHGPRTLFNFSAREMTVPDVRWPREWEIPHQAQLRPGTEISLNVSLTPRKRGIIKLWGITVPTYFPFFMTRLCRKVHTPASVFVVPQPLRVQLPPLRHLAEKAADNDTSGLKQGRATDSHEYAFSRQYQPGDSIRRLDQRASGRRGEPMSKVFEGINLNKLDKIHMLVDTSLKSFLPWQPRPTTTDPLDRRLPLAPELAVSAAHDALHTAAIAWNSSWKAAPTMLSVYEQIAACSPARTPRLPENLPDPNGIYVAVLGCWTPDIETTFRAWRKGGAVILVFLLPETQAESGTLPRDTTFIEVRA
ncbi:MAG: DUF58 domain-containing protein [Deltaproteobacteria bacterium]|nr:DUF58 domain-containing protein [Deltaproteobacteria bacterium]